MTVDEIKAAIERRGYAVRIVNLPGQVLFYIGRHIGGKKSTMIVVRSYSLEDLGTVKMPVGEFVEIALGAFSQGQQHCQLAYRSVLEGPQGKSLLECPQCQQCLRDDSVEEIIDE